VSYFFNVFIYAGQRDSTEKTSKIILELAGHLRLIGRKWRKQQIRETISFNFAAGAVNGPLEMTAPILYNKDTRWLGAKDFCNAYFGGQELLSLIRFTFTNVKTHLIIEVEADSYHAAKRNMTLGQTKIDD